MASPGSVPYFEKLGERPFTKGVADTGRGGAWSVAEDVDL
jgi:hypothetical protein